MNFTGIINSIKSLGHHRKKFIIFLVVCFLVMLLSYLRTVFAVPGEMTLLEGEEHVIDLKSPFLVSIKADKIGVVKLNDGEIGKKQGYFKLSSPLLLRPQKNGSVSLNLRILGVIPLRTIKVDVVPNKKIAACGNTIGVKLKIDGILVIGISDVETIEGKRITPAKQSGIKQGDLITEISNRKVNSVKELLEEIEKSRGEKVDIKYKRGNNRMSGEIQPVKSVDDQKYRIGLWVRESTAGIGTMTFYDPETQCFGALGHGIADIDTGALMPVLSGEILESQILTIKKGKQGNPGELRGVFIEENKLGTINTNCEYGIYGSFNSESLNKISHRLYPIALKSDIREGPATILSNINGKDVEEFKIDIIKVSRQNTEGTKGMVIKVTDKKLLNKTGGIVQGMSGSPILQNGKIVGAVTHVLVNDPTRGYGIFIERMVKNLDGANSGRLNSLAEAG